METYTNLVFEGGGVKGIAYVGALRVLTSHNLLSNFTSFAGSSAGAIVATLLACNATTEYMEKTIISLDFSKFMDDSWGIFRDFYRILTSYGLYKGDELLQLFETILKDTTGSKDITFAELYDKTQKVLVITGSNVNTCKSEYYSKDTTPTMKVKNALRITVSIPFVFKPIISETGDLLVDGGTYNNMPMNVFRESEDFTLGLRLMSDVDKMGRKEIKGLKNYASELVGNLSDLACSKFVTSSDELRIVDIPTEKVKSTDFGLDDTVKEWLINSGQTAMTQFIKKNLLLK